MNVFLRLLRFARNDASLRGAPEERRSNLVCSIFLLLLFSVIHSQIVQAASPESPCNLIEKYQKIYRSSPTAANKKQLATIENNCGVEQGNKNKWNTAEQHLQKARSLDPGNPMVNKSLANIIASRAGEAYKANQFRAAREDFEKALRYDPGNADIKVGLSQVLYRLESRTDHARDLLTAGAKGGVGIPGIEKKVQQYDREVGIEKITREETYGNWVLRFQEGISGVSPDKVFRIIEDVSNKVGDDFQYWIKHPVVFILIDEANFQKVHMGPGWAGALNDGRIKVPVTGAYKGAKEFKSVLAHEYTHSVINDFAHGNPVPFWFHEGMAEYEEHRIVGENPADPKNFPDLITAYRNHTLLPMKLLSEDGAAEKLSGSQVHLAYEQSLSFVIYLQDIYYFHSLLSFIRTLGDGKPFNEAIVKGVGRNLSFLEEEWKDWLGRNLPKAETPAEQAQ